MTLTYHPYDKIKFGNVAKATVFDKNFQVLEFGVATGNTLTAWLDSALELHKKPTQVLGFDSFKGLPNEQPGVKNLDEWFPGAFNIVSELKAKGQQVTEEDGVKIVDTRFDKYRVDGIPVELVVGWYSDTLTKELIIEKQIKDVGYVHIDCDIYISAIQSLDFIFDNDLLLDQALIRFDDWKDDPEIGEHKAFNEVVKRLGLTLHYIGNDGFNGKLYRYHR